MAVDPERRRQNHLQLQRVASHRFGPVIGAMVARLEEERVYSKYGQSVDHYLARMGSLQAQINALSDADAQRHREELTRQEMERLKTIRAQSHAEAANIINMYNTEAGADRRLQLKARYDELLEMKKKAEEQYYLLSDAASQTPSAAPDVSAVPAPVSMQQAPVPAAAVTAAAAATGLGFAGPAVQPPSHFGGAVHTSGAAAPPGPAVVGGGPAPGPAAVPAAALARASAVPPKELIEMVLPAVERLPASVDPQLRARAEELLRFSRELRRLSDAGQLPPNATEQIMRVKSASEAVYREHLELTRKREHGTAVSGAVAGAPVAGVPVQQHRGPATSVEVTPVTAAVPAAGAATGRPASAEARPPTGHARPQAPVVAVALPAGMGSGTAAGAATAAAGAVAYGASAAGVAGIARSRSTSGQTAAAAVAAMPLSTPGTGPGAGSAVYAPPATAGGAVVVAVPASAAVSTAPLGQAPLPRPDGLTKLAAVVARLPPGTPCQALARVLTAVRDPLEQSARSGWLERS